MTPEGEDPGLDGGRVGARWALVNDGERSLAVSAGGAAIAPTAGSTSSPAGSASNGPSYTPID